MSGCGDCAYFIFAKSSTNFITPAVEFLKQLWDYAVTVEEADVIIEVHYVGSRDMNERLIAEFDVDLIGKAIEKLRASMGIV